MMCEILLIIIQYFCGRFSPIGCVGRVEKWRLCVENKNSIFGFSAVERFSVMNVFDTYNIYYNIIDLMIYVYTLLTL